MLASDGPRILLIDDEDLLSFCIEMELCATGYQVRTAHTLKAAGEAFATFTPDLLICDHSLPDGWGMEFVKGLEHAVPVIMITAFTPPPFEKIDTVRRLLLKPFDLKVLMKEVDQLLRLRTFSRPGSSPCPPPGAAAEG